MLSHWAGLGPRAPLGRALPALSRSRRLTPPCLRRPRAAVDPVATSSTNRASASGGLGFDALGQCRCQTRPRLQNCARQRTKFSPLAGRPHPLPSSPQSVQGVEYVLTGLDRLVNWARKSSMWPMTFGLA